METLLCKGCDKETAYYIVEGSWGPHKAKVLCSVCGTFIKWGKPKPKLSPTSDWESLCSTEPIKGKP